MGRGPASLGEKECIQSRQDLLGFKRVIEGQGLSFWMRSLDCTQYEIRSHRQPGARKQHPEICLYDSLFRMNWQVVIRKNVHQEVMALCYPSLNGCTRRVLAVRSKEQHTGSSHLKIISENLEIIKLTEEYDRKSMCIAIRTSSNSIVYCYLQFNDISILKFFKILLYI